MYGNYVTSAALLIDILGAALLTIQIFVTRERAIELAIPRFAGATVEENLSNPQVQDRLKGSKYAKWGLVLLIVGFAGQLVGVWI